MSKDRLFLVPGNHDVDRWAVNSDSQERMYERAKESEKHEKLINERVDKKSHEYMDMLSRLSQYQDFIRDFLPQIHDPDGRVTYGRKINISGIAIGIFGFNTAWSCAGENDDRSLWLPSHWAFNRALDDLNEADLKIALMHHPIDWLNHADRQLAESRLATDFHFLLHGHDHKAWIDAGESTVRMSAGAIGAEDSEEFGFHLVSLDLEEGVGETRVYGFKKGGTQWVPRALDALAPLGKKEFHLPKRVGRWRGGSIRQSEPLKSDRKIATDKKRFVCTKLWRDSDLPLGEFEIPYRQLSDPIEDELTGPTSNCLIWMPRERYFSKLADYTPAIALCVASVESASYELSDVLDASNGKCHTKLPRDLRETDRNSVFDSICKALDQAFVAAFLVPKGMISVATNDWMLGYETILNFILPPVAELHHSAGFSKVQFILPGSDTLTTSIIERTKRILRASSLNKSSDISTTLASSSDDSARLYYVGASIAWAVHMAYNRADKSRLNQLVGALGGAAPA